jgi:hypothetical protein
VEPSQEEQEWIDQQRREAREQEDEYNAQTQPPEEERTQTPTVPHGGNDNSKQSGNVDMSNMNFGNMNMDMMQQMQQMMSQGINPMAMMGKSSQIGPLIDSY